MRNLYDRLHDKVLIKYVKNPVTECYSKDYVFKYQEEIYDATVIIPCYNVEKYVAECMESILKQKTSYNIEIIAIDDGSTDSTAEILCRYSTKIKNFRIITQCNKGFSGARNTGIREARGKYLIFIDSDDYVTSDYIDFLLKKAFSKDADIVETGYYTFNNENRKKLKNITIKDENDTSLLNGCAWGKAIKRKFFEHLVFPENYWYEDSIIAHLVVPRANSIYMVSKCQYAYRSNPTGITKTSVNSLRAIESFYITDLMLHSYVHFYSEDVTNTQEFINLLIEQFYLNEKRVIRLNSEIKRTIFMYQCKYVHTLPIMDLKLEFSKKLYAIGLLKNNYQIAQIGLRLDILNKIIRRIKNK